MLKTGIIIPTYNNSDTIIQTIDSIQNQKEHLKKIFIVYIADDCSKDNSVSLVEREWKNLIPLHIGRGQENVGQWNNVNRAIDFLKETVDWVLILHSDDIAKPNWLEIMLSRIETCSEKVGSICSSWDNLLPNGCVVLGEDDPTKQIEVIEGNNEAVRGSLRTGCWWHISGCAIRIKTFEDCGGFNQKFPYQADWEWLLRYLQKGWSIEYIPRTLILYRQSIASVSSKAFQTHQDIKEFIEIIPKYINFLEPTDIFHLHLQRIKFTVRRMIKSIVTLNTQRFLQCFYILLMLRVSLKKCKK